MTPADLPGWIRGEIRVGARYIFGLCGPPGAGKSTIATHVAAALAEQGVSVSVVPMDGYHHPNAWLDERGLRSVKGAPETFDADRFVETVVSLRRREDDVWVAAFDRASDDPVEQAISVRQDTEVVIVEGNYLLLDLDPWVRLRQLFDAVAFIELPVETRRERLVARHVSFGKTPTEAAAFVVRSDEANASLVNATKHRADVVVRR